MRRFLLILAMFAAALSAQTYVVQDASGNANVNAATATALKTTPTACTNQFARGIAASGNASCAAVAGTDFSTQTANTILAGPATGAAAKPTFRALVASDIPGGLIDLTIFAASVDTGTDTVTIAAGRVQIDNIPYNILQGTAVGPTGAGNVYFYIDGTSHALTAGKGTGITSAGTLTNVADGGDVTTPFWPAGSIPLALCTVATNNYGTCTAYKSYISSTVNSPTASALAADPSDCTNQFARGIGANGNAACASVASTDFGTQVKNLVLAGPATGVDATPTFRALTADDVPVPSDLSPLTTTVDTGTDTVTVTAGTARFDQIPYSITQGTAVSPTGAGNVYFYIDSVSHALTAGKGTGITSAGTLTNIANGGDVLTPFWPIGSIPISVCTVAADNYASCASYKAYLAGVSTAPYWRKYEVTKVGFGTLSCTNVDISAVVYTPIGAPGLNDATSGGTYSGTGTHTYTVIVDLADATDTFKWQKDAGAFTEDVPMTGAAQLLTDGITITFAATTGHTLGDQWVITVTDLGCWSVNGGTAVAATAGLTQDLVLFQLPANGDVDRVRFKSSVASTGTTTAKLTDVGLTGTAGFFATGLTYDLMAAVTNTNLLVVPLTATGSDTVAATNITATITTTVENVNLIATGTKFDVWVKWGQLP